MPGMPSRSGAGPFLSPKAPSPDCEGCHKARRRLWLEPPSAKLLFPQTQLLDQVVVPRQVLLLEIGQQAAALVHHHQKTTTGVIVLVVLLEVLGQVADALGEDRDLDFRRPGIALPLVVVLDDSLLLFGGNRHSFTPRYR